jgi:predicted HicB family RNase H-like nuclease
MKRIIDGKSYNTDTATKIAYWGSLDRGGETADLYQNRNGAFFEVGFDGYHEPGIRPLTDPEAQAWLEKYANHLVEQYFGAMPESGAAERRLTIRIPGNLADRIEIAAKAKGVSVNSYVMRCFERCAAQDGQPAAGA